VTACLDAVFSGWHKRLMNLPDWQDLVAKVTPRVTGCGMVYEVTSGSPDFSLAIADMRGIAYAHPHYHTHGEAEFYFVLQGQGQVLLGYDVHSLRRHDTLVIPPDVAHCVVAPHDLVLVNNPPFCIQNSLDLFSSDERVRYDHAQFQQLIAELPVFGSSRSAIRRSAGGLNDG
jgi:quercetin dioxygenase-like cupin family protein